MVMWNTMLQPWDSFLTGMHSWNNTVELPQVAAVAHLLHGYGINIVETDQFTDPDSAVYFQRLKVD